MRSGGWGPCDRISALCKEDKDETRAQPRPQRTCRSCRPQERALTGLTGWHPHDLGLSAVTVTRVYFSSCGQQRLVRRPPGGGGPTGSSLVNEPALFPRPLGSRGSSRCGSCHGLEFCLFQEKQSQCASEARSAESRAVRLGLPGIYLRFTWDAPVAVAPAALWVGSCVPSLCLSSPAPFSVPSKF